MNAKSFANIVLMLGLAALYGISYAANVRPTAPVAAFSTYTPEPSYLVGGKAAEAAFYPAHRADRFLRPDLWDPRSPVS